MGHTSDVETRNPDDVSFAPAVCRAFLCGSLARSGWGDYMESAMYMLVRNGRIQLIPMELDCGTTNGIFLAASHDQATQAARCFEKTTGKKGIRPALIGSIPGESLDSLYDYADECDLAFAVLVGWADGKPMLQPLTRRVSK